MKKYLFFLLIIPSLVFAGGIQNHHTAVLSQYNAGGGSSDCPSRTYMAYWDGDHSSGNTYVCLDSGNSTAQGTLNTGTISTTYGESGSNGLYISAADDCIYWTGLGNDFFDEDGAITVWLRVQFETTDGTDNTLSIWELVEASPDDDHISIRATDDEYIRGYWYGTGTGDYEASSSTFSRDGSTWYSIGYSVRQDAASSYAEDDTVSINAGSSWAAENDDPAAMAGELTTLILGNYTIYTSGGDPISIDKMEIISGWQQSCPW